MASRNPKFNTKQQRFPVSITFERYVNDGTITQNEIDLIKKYVAYKKATAKHFSERRANNISIVLTYCRKYIKTPYTLADIDDIIIGIGELKNGRTDKGAPYSQNTVHTYITILKGFLYYLSDKNLSKLSEKQVKEIKSPGMDKHTTAPENILTADDIAKLIGATNNPMYKALIVLSFESGARPEEINALQWSDLKADQYGYVLSISDFKTDKKKTARLTKSAPYLVEWQKATPKNASTDYIFVGKYGDPLTYNSTISIIARIHKKSGITKPITLYSFRKGRINDMVKTNMPQPLIRSQIWNNQGTQMLDVYLALDNRALDEMALNHLGIKKSESVTIDPLTPITCANCHTVNEHDHKFCKTCGFALTEQAVNEKQALEEKVDATPEMADIMKQLKELQDQVALMRRAKA